MSIIGAQRCPVSGKRSYSGPGLAMAECERIARMGKGRLTYRKQPEVMNAYRCKDCGYYHIGHKERRKR